MEVEELKASCGCGDAQHIRTLLRLKSALFILSSSVTSKRYQVQTARQHLEDLQCCYSDLERSLQVREQRLAEKAKRMR